MWAIPTAIAAFADSRRATLLLDRRCDARPWRRANAAAGDAMIRSSVDLLAHGTAVGGRRDRERAATRPTRGAGTTPPSGGCTRSRSSPARFLPDVVNGVIVLADGARRRHRQARAGQRRERPRAKSAKRARARWGNRLFIPALAIPAVTIIGSKYLKAMHVRRTRHCVDPKQVTIVCARHRDARGAARRHG